VGVFRELADELSRVVEEALVSLWSIGDEEAAERRASDKWSRKQILGHLLDSETNNRQRIVRAQSVEELVLPGYDQEAWVRAHGYAERPWSELVELWRANNRNLAELIRRVPEAAASVPCRIGGGLPMTLQAIVVDYLRHMRHHLAQLEIGAPAGGARDGLAP
jgi:galactose-1-phosphate uridylyltransferase